MRFEQTGILVIIHLLYITSEL